MDIFFVVYRGISIAKNNWSQINGFERRKICVECSSDLMMFCVIPESHPLSEKNILTFNDISGQNFVSFPNGTYIRYEIDRILEKNHVNCRVKLETRSTADIYQHVKHGAGISIVFPFLQFGEKPIPGTLFKPVKSNFKLSLAILRSKRKDLSLVAKKFLEIIGQFSQLYFSFYNQKSFSFSGILCFVLSSHSAYFQDKGSLSHQADYTWTTCGNRLNRTVKSYSLINNFS